MVVLPWWALAVIVRSGYVPLAFGSRRLWAATADSALLCIVMAHYASLARRVDQAAAALAVPEIAWTAFATVLERGGRQEEQLTGGPAPGQPNPVTKTMRAVAGLITDAQIDSPGPSPACRNKIPSPALTAGTGPPG